MVLETPYVSDWKCDPKCKHEPVDDVDEFHVK